MCCALRTDGRRPFPNTRRRSHWIATGCAHYTNLGWCKLYAGSIEEVIPLVEQAIRLSPRDPDMGIRYILIGTVHLLQSHTDEAIVWLEKARSAMPAAPIPSQPPRLRLCPQRRDRTRRRRTRRSPEAERRRSFFEHRPPEGRSGCMVGGAEDPRAVRSHLFRRSAQGRDAGGMSARVAWNFLVVHQDVGYGWKPDLGLSQKSSQPSHNHWHPGGSTYLF